MRDRRDLDRLSTDELYRRGVAAARVGESAEARAFLQAAIDREPDHADAVLWLAGLEDAPSAKRDLFRRVLELRPDDPEAQDGLDRLVEKYGGGVLADDDVETLVCTWHPDRETLLRCTRCGRAMCTECAVRHPVGLRCRGCVKELRSPVFVVSPGQVVAAGVAGVVVSVVGGGLLYAVSRFGFLFLIAAFLGGPAAGAAIADMVGRAAGRKRGRTLAIVSGASIVVGTLIGWVVGFSLFAGPAVAAAQGVPLAELVSWLLVQGMSRLLSPWSALGFVGYVVMAVRASTARLQ